MVLEYINANPDLELTAGIISKELGRSSGAISNAFDRLIEAGAVQAVGADKKTVTALPAESDTE